MANQKALTDWILKNQDQLDLKVRECTWIRKAFPGWFDIDLSIRINEKTFFGRGSASEPDLALSKAFCEAVERNICASHGISSTGVAGHVVPLEARENARLEFFERKLLANSIARGELGPKVNEYSVLRERYSHLGIEIEIYEISASDTMQVFMCIAKGARFRNPFGGILGLGASNSKQTAIEKALIECLRNLEAYIENPVPFLTKKQFDELENKTGMDRQALFRDRSYFADFSKRLKDSSPVSDSEIRFSFEPLKIIEPSLLSCPLHFYRCFDEAGDFLQPEFVG